jgi:hypothetical protein
VAGVGCLLHGRGKSSLGILIDRGKRAETWFFTAVERQHVTILRRDVPKRKAPDLNEVGRFVFCFGAEDWKRSGSNNNSKLPRKVALRCSKTRVNLVPMSPIYMLSLSAVNTYIRYA